MLQTYGTGLAFGSLLERIPRSSGVFCGLLGGVMGWIGKRFYWAGAKEGSWFFWVLLPLLMMTELIREGLTGIWKHTWRCFFFSFCLLLFRTLLTHNSPLSYGLAAQGATRGPNSRTWDSGFGLRREEGGERRVWGGGGLASYLPSGWMERKRDAVFSFLSFSLSVFPLLCFPPSALVCLSFLFFVLYLLLFAGVTTTPFSLSL